MTKFDEMTREQLIEFLEKLMAENRNLKQDAADRSWDYERLRDLAMENWRIEK